MANPQKPPQEGERFVEVRSKDRLYRSGGLDFLNATSYLDKVQDAKLLLVTANDKEFVAKHHAVRDLLEANNLLGKQGYQKLEIADIYDALRAGDHQILVTKLDNRGQPAVKMENGQPVLENGKPVIEKRDLFDQSQINKMLVANDLLPEFVLDDNGKKVPCRFSKKEIEEAVLAGAPLEREVPELNQDGKEVDKDGNVVERDATGKAKGIIKKKLVDLYIEAPMFTLSPDEFAEYENAIKNYQPVLQPLSNQRDSAITNHHAENGGHAQYVNIGIGENAIVPVSAGMAADYVRADVRKVNAATKAKGHVHEVGWYEELTSCTVKFEFEAVQLWRGDITATRVAEQTDTRMSLNSIALGNGENPVVGKDEYFFGGEGGSGRIYKAMRNHYDDAMEKVRGYKITDDEIGDRIATDIVGVRFAATPLDWLMCFARATRMYTPEDVIKKEFIGGDKEFKGKPVFKFRAKKPLDKSINFSTSLPPLEPDKAKIDWEYGVVELSGVQALKNYMQWRVAMGDIPGADPSYKIQLNAPSKEAIKKDAKEAEEDEGKKDVSGKPPELGLADVENVSILVKAIFGRDAKKFVQARAEGRPEKVSQINAKDPATGKPAKFSIDTDDKLKIFLEKQVQAGGGEVAGALTKLGMPTEATAAAEAIMKYLGEIGEENFKLILKALK